MPDIGIRRVSDLIRDIDDSTLVLRPPFQRRLVWTNVVKDHFLETVTLGLPFPEIFIATGEIDTKTMKRKNLLVDGQQRISTLREYVQNSTDLVLRKVQPYRELNEMQKGKFLDYKVVVRDLGQVTEAEIKDIFARINSTNYALKAMERLNSQFSGAYNEFCEKLSRHKFFEQHEVFSDADFRRMRDLDFCVILTTTLLSTYYQRDTLNREFLQRYNDEFSKGPELLKKVEAVFTFIEKCAFDKTCRVWKKTDLLTVIVELHAFQMKNVELDPAKVKGTLEQFYSQVDEMFALRSPAEELEAKASTKNVFRYLKAATKATNDKYARVDRAEVISGLLQSTLETKPVRKEATKKSKR